MIKFISYDFKPFLNEGVKIKNMDIDLMIAYHLISSQTKEGVEIPLETPFRNRVRKLC